MSDELLYVTSERMKELDRSAIEDHGIPAEKLMEAAGRALSDEVLKSSGSGAIYIFCGYGNNGGDGLVAARHLHKSSRSVSVFFVGKPRSLSPETNSNLERLFSLNINPKFITKKEEIVKLFSEGSPAVIIDAVFGIGLKGKPDGIYDSLFSAINSSGSVVISADVPSGLDADTGKASGGCVKASVTVTFGYPKIGFKDPEAKQYTGKLVVADIGLPKAGAPAAKTKIHSKAIKLRSGKLGITRPGHPWIFSRQLLKTDPAIKPGDIISVIGPDGKFLGKGYYNYHSDIAIRILTDKDESIDQAFFDSRFEEALLKRKHLKDHTDAYRVIFSESDGLPGLIVDRYCDTVVFQVLTLGMERLKNFAVESIRSKINPRYIYEKSVSPFREIEGLKDEAKWHGDAGRQVVKIHEGKARFLVDIINGHKTGFYLDQRRSRLALDGTVKNKTVLDIFSYTGAFAISAAMYGAASVTSVDVKGKWLELGQQEALLNGVSDKIIFIESDAFEFLDRTIASGVKFDVVILDPPSFLKNKQSLKSAIKGYEELNTKAMSVVSDKGVLATFSCSHNMPNSIFAEVIKNSAIAAGKKFTILKRCHQDIDHPIVRSIPETEYLKGYFLNIETK